MDNPPSNQKAHRLKRAVRIVVVCLVLVIVAFAAMTFAQAWSMTHYEPVTAQTTRMAQLSTWGKVRVLICGPVVRRQSNTRTPEAIGLEYQTCRFPGAHGLGIEAWRIDGPAGAPAVVMFPGYGASKDTLLAAAEEFAAMHYTVWMVDPHGIGGSEGRATSLGYHEADDVAAACREARRLQPRSLLLYGTSMGAVAIMRAIAVGSVGPDAVILECPFDRLTNTIGNRFVRLGLPRIPFAPAVALWAGAQQGFNGLAHNPVEYAHYLRCPALLLQGERDESVGRPFVHEVGGQLGTNGHFELIPEAGHSFLVTRSQAAWRRSVRQFLSATFEKPAAQP